MGARQQRVERLPLVGTEAGSDLGIDAAHLAQRLLRPLAPLGRQIEIDAPLIDSARLAR